MKEQKSTQTAYLCKTSIEEPIKQQKQQIKIVAASNKKSSNHTYLIYA